MAYAIIILLSATATLLLLKQRQRKRTLSNYSEIDSDRDDKESTTVPLAVNASADDLPIMRYFKANFVSRIIMQYIDARMWKEYIYEL